MDVGAEVAPIKDGAAALVVVHHHGSIDRLHTERGSMQRLL
jgi:hypothetical protein